jgi:hypothetical protein
MTLDGKITFIICTRLATNVCLLLAEAGAGPRERPEGAVKATRELLSGL